MLDIQTLLGNFILRDEKSPDLFKNIIPAGKLTKDAALEVYRRDYLARMTSVLGENYPSVWYVLGDEMFFLITDEFIKKFDSTSFDIGDYGRQFPKFLADHSIIRDFPFLADLAIFEKNFLRIFHSPFEESPVLNFSENDFLSLRFKFIEGIHFQKSNYKIFEIWNLKSHPHEEFNIFSPSNLVLYKNKSGIKTSFFNEIQVSLLEKLQSGAKLGDALNEKINSDEVEEIFKFISSSGILREVI